MPFYQYRCEFCDFEFEEYQSIKSSSLKRCPKCSKHKLKRLIGKIIFYNPTVSVDRTPKFIDGEPVKRGAANKKELEKRFKEKYGRKERYSKKEARYGKK